MICYKDRTFCASDCTNSECWRNFGPDQGAAAKRWAATFGRKDNPPVSLADFSEKCEDYIPRGLRE